MKKVRHLFHLLFLLQVLLPVSTRAQNSATECRNALRDALQLRNAPVDSCCAFYRSMTLTTCTRAGDTVRTQAVSIEAGDLYVIRSDSSEMWQDSELMAIIDHRQLTIRVVDIRGRQDVRATRRHLQDVFPDSLMRHVRNVACTTGYAEDTRVVTGSIVPEKQVLYGIRTITVEIRSDDEITRFAVEHPVGSHLLTTEYVVDELDRAYRGISNTKTVRSYLFNTDGALRTDFTDYRLAGNK